MVDINVVVGKDGKIKIQGIRGKFGPGCEGLTRELEKQGKLISKKKTADYDKSGPDVSISAELSK